MIVMCIYNSSFVSTSPCYKFVFRVYNRACVSDSIVVTAIYVEHNIVDVVLFIQPSCPACLLFKVAQKLAPYFVRLNFIKY